MTGGWPVRTASTAQHKLNPNRNIFGVVQASVNWPVGQWDIEETDVLIENNTLRGPVLNLTEGIRVSGSGNMINRNNKVDKPRSGP